jgi:predicted kinase
MRDSFLVIVTGLPASGKTTLAMQLATRYGVPLLAKDLIKEPLLDTLGASDATESRRLSDASFRIAAAVAAEIVRAGASCILEGNFRAGEHESLVAPLLRDARSFAQVLCRIDEDQRLARLRVRRTDRARHPGHRDLEQAEAAGATQPRDDFLDVPGARLLAGPSVLAQLDAILMIKR